MKNVTFVTAEIGRGLEAVYCWSDEFMVPASSIFFKQEGISVGDNETSVRITILGKQSYGSEYERQVLLWLQQQCSLIVFPFGSIKEAVVSKQLALFSSGFKFDDKTASFVWVRDENTILPSKTTDMSIAKLLGWTKFKDNENGVLLGIPPNVEVKQDEIESSIEAKRKSVPRWSREIAPAIALLFELKEVHGFSNIFKQSGSFHFVSISDEVSDVVSGAHSEISGAIADAVVRYLIEYNNREALKEKTKGEPENGTGNVQS